MPPTPPTKPKRSKAPPKTVAEYTILPLALPTQPHLPSQYRDTKHYIYIKPHAPSTPTPTSARSLFISNIPIDATETNLRALFVEQLGGAMLERVDFDACVPAQPLHKRWKIKQTEKEKEKADQRGKKRKRNEEELVAEGVVEDEDSALPAIWPGSLRRSGSAAVLVFVDKRSARGAMKGVIRAVKEDASIHWKTGDAALGVARYTSHLHLLHPPPPLLQHSLTSYLTQYTHLESLRARHRSTSRAVPDAEGFVTVSRGGRVGPARIEEAQRKQKELADRKAKNAVKDDFYRFQNRERRKEVEVGLRRRFEEDRERVWRMREGRGVGRPEV